MTSAERESLISCQFSKLIKHVFWSDIANIARRLYLTSHMGTSSWNFRPPAAPPPPTPHAALAQEKPLTPAVSSAPLITLPFIFRLPRGQTLALCLHIGGMRGSAISVSLTVSVYLRGRWTTVLSVASQEPAVPLQDQSYCSYVHDHTIQHARTSILLHFNLFSVAQYRTNACEGVCVVCIHSERC